MILLIVVTASLAAASLPPELQRLTDESVAKCQATAGTKATPEMITDKVNQAVTLLESEGTAAFHQFRGADSPYLFAGTYIWIHRIDGTMLMHPIKPQLEGRPLLALRGTKGKQIFVIMNQVVQAQAEGDWVDYWWPKPGEKIGSHKVSFVKKADVDSETMVVGCGTYDLSEAKIATLNPK